MSKTYRYLLLFVASICCIPTGHTQTWEAFNTQNSNIISNTILALATDKSNNLWVGTNIGPCRFKGKTWTDVTPEHAKLKNQYINCITVDNDGKLWFGTDDFGPIMYDGNKWTDFPKETHQFNMKLIHSIAIDVNDVKWISVTLNGLVRYDGFDWEKYTPNDSKLTSDFILCTAIDRANRKWIGTNAGLCIYNGRSWTVLSKRNTSIPSDIIPDIVIDHDNIKWVGTIEGLCRFDGEKWTVYNTKNSPLPSNQINTLSLDNDGRLWIGTSKGVAVFDRVSRWDSFTSKNSPLPAEASILTLSASPLGTIWIGTDFYGLFSLSNYQFPAIETAKNNTPAESKTNQDSQPATSESSTSTPKPSNGVLNVKVVPNLEMGYVVLQFDGTENATVEFVNSDGKTMRTVNNYNSGNRIGIAKLPKGKYTLNITTPSASKSLKFNLK